MKKIYKELENILDILCNIVQNCIKDKNIYNKFDFRTQKQVVDDLKKIKPNVYPVIHPKHNVTKNSKLTSNLFLLVVFLNPQ